MVTKKSGFIVTKRKFFNLVREILPQAEIVEDWREIARCSKNLMCFCTPVIIPSAILDVFDVNRRHNFHPGSRFFPGSHCEAWAKYQEATEFGAVVHQMLKKVDSGPIVAELSAQVPKSATAQDIREIGEASAIQLFRQTASKLWCEGSKDPCTAWSGPVRTMADACGMLNMDDCSIDEKELRLQAFGHLAKRCHPYV